MMLKIPDNIKTEEEVHILFQGMGIGAEMMLGFEKMKNVNTGKPLKFSEFISDLNTIEEQAIFLKRKGGECVRESEDRDHLEVNRKWAKKHWHGTE